MSKKTQKLISQNFDKAFNFENFVSHDQLNDEPVGSDFLDQFATELTRLEKLSIPLAAHHIDKFNEIVTPVEHPTDFQRVKWHFQGIKYLADKLEELQNSLLNSPNANDTQKSEVTALNMLHETYSLAMFKLGMSVGAHNQEMNSSYFANSGIRKLQSEQLKAYKQYDKKYSKALEITRCILPHFYGIESNRPYKPSLVIDYIQMLCEHDNIDYPSDRKAEIFKELINGFLKPIPPHKNWNGATKGEYKQIDWDNFSKKYRPYIKASD